METKLYKIKGLFAKENKLPVYFAGVQLAETNRARYLFGKFTTETIRMGVCCVCGRDLTHPVSVALGIGPFCGGHWWDWNLIGGYSMENIERLKHELGVRMQETLVDTWIPKSVINEILPSEITVDVPSDHKMLNYRTENEKVVSAKKVSLSSNRELLIIHFPYNFDDLAHVRALENRRFHGDGADKFWTVPVLLETIQRLKSWGFALDSEVQDLVDRYSTPINAVQTITVSGLKGQLYPFQNQGVSFIEKRNGRALIADEMGLGKTVQALAWLQLHPEKRPAIIVVPASLKLNWLKEATTWMSNPKVEVLSGTNSHRPHGEIIIINYDILPDWLDVLITYKPQVVITDECHYYKNNAAKRTKAVKELGKHTRHFIALSGTPIVNRPVEAFNAIKLIDPSVVPDFFRFAQRYCAARHNGYGWDFTGASNTEELHNKLVNTIMIRRKKSEVLTELPEKTWNFMPMELDNLNEYRRAESNFISFVREQKGAAAAHRASNAEALAEIEGLKQLAVQGKMKQAIEWIRDFLEVDGKLVVFAVHKFVIDALMNEFGNITVKIDGSVSMSDRDKAVTAFQNNPNIRLFVGNIRAAGVGLTLTAASNVAFLELPWTPGELTQAEDRCHRIGQKDAVNVHYLLAAGTIEERIARLIDKKRKVLSAVLDGEEDTSESMLSELMDEYDEN